MNTKTRITALATLLMTTWLPPAFADGEAEFLLFLSADNLERDSISNSSVPSSDFTPTADFLFSYANGPWRILGEYFLTDDENELERLQLGYDFTQDGTIWLGRFHQPISVWNHRYHHGAYLQPSISRPAIENWEDDNGVIPAHVTGLMLEAWQPTGDSNGIRYAAAFGIAPTLELDELLPFDILDPGDSGNRPAGSINISYVPDYVGESSFGLIAGYADIEAQANPTLGISSPFSIEQTVFGVHGNWTEGDWQFIAAAYYVNNKEEGTTVDVGGWFLSGYAQALLQFGNNTSTYARAERTKNHSAGYLTMFPQFVYQRELLGFRWDFSKRQAVALEVSNNRVRTDDYSEFRIQWSAAFP